MISEGRFRHWGAGLALVALSFLSALTSPAAASAAGSISGTVTAADGGAPVAGVKVCATIEFGFEESDVFCTHSGAGGAYVIEGLRPGDYKVEFLSGVEGLNYVYQAWEAKRVPFLADLVAVDEADVPGIDAELEEGGRISGRVVNAANGAPLAGVEVCAEPGGLENMTGCATTDPSGHYTIVGLGTETYWVEFFPPEESEFLSQYYDEEPGILFADDVEVTVGALTPNVDAALHEAGQIEGTATDALSHAPLAGVDVCAWEAVPPGYLGPCGETDFAGRYRIRRVPAGTYNVSFNQFHRARGYGIQWFRCSNGPPGTTPVTVATATATTGIDVALAPDLSTACPAPAAAPAAPTLLPKRKPRHRAHRKCPKGKHRKLVRGKRRCVKVQRKKKHRHHGHHRAISARA